MATVSKSKNVSKSEPKSKPKAAHTFKQKGAKKAEAKIVHKSHPFDYVAAEAKYYIESQAKLIFKQQPDPKSKRHLELHPSSFPYCGLRHAFRLLTNAPKQDMDFYGEYYTSLGTMAHELMQKYLGRGKRMLGDWKCHDCGKTTAFSTYAPCPKCRSPNMHYEELGIKFGKWTHGHVDGVVKVNGKWYVLDYKTTSTKNNAEHRAKGNKYPYKGNLAQVTAYICYLEAMYDIEIDGWMLIYVTRDSSFRDYVIVGDLVTEKQKAKTLEKLQRYDDHFGKVMKIKDDLQLKYFKRLVQEKPCESLKAYKAEMHDGYNWCELAKDGTCFDSRKLRVMLGNLVNKKEGRPQIVAEL